MRVKTLIERLKKFNPEAEVRLNDYNGEPALFVNARSNDDSIVYIDGPNDIDMGEEISSRFANAPIYFNTYVGFYEDLISIGITIDMVREHMGEAYASTMEKICIEAGLI